jgi:hypothetical protein
MPGALAIGGIVASVYGSRTAGRSNRQALKYESASTSQAMRMETDNETRRREEFDRSERLAEQAWNAEQERLDRQEARDEQRYQTELRESQRRTGLENAARIRDQNMDRTRFNANAPYRATGTAALAELAQLAGLSVTPGAEVPMIPGETYEDVPPSAPAPTAPTTTPPPSSAVSPVTTGPLVAPTPPTPAPRTPKPTPRAMPTADADGLVEFRMSREAYATLAGEQARRAETPPLDVAGLIPRRRDRVPLRSLTQYPRSA